MTPQEMYETAKSRNMKIDPAEEKYHFLLHQRISKIIAEERFGIDDAEILSAVECHTTLKKNAGCMTKSYSSRTKYHGIKRICRRIMIY